MEKEDAAMKYEIFVYEEAKTASFYKKAIAEYEKRLNRYCRISYRFIKKEKEWERIFTSAGDSYILLPGRESVSSEDFSEEMKKWELSGKGKIIFFIPGEEWQKKLGKDEIACSVDRKMINLSDFSMNTAMSTLILYEQIYRGYRILNHHPYHK